MGKIFANHIAHKCIISKVYKEHLQLNNKRNLSFYLKFMYLFKIYLKPNLKMGK